MSDISDSILKISASCALFSMTILMCQEFYYKNFEKEMYMKACYQGNQEWESVNTEYVFQSLYKLWIKELEDLWMVENPSEWQILRRDYLRRILNEIKYIVKD